MSTRTQRHRERKRQKLTVEERRREREAAMILEKKDKKGNWLTSKLVQKK